MELNSAWQKLARAWRAGSGGESSGRLLPALVRPGGGDEVVTLPGEERDGRGDLRVVGRRRTAPAARPGGPAPRHRSPASAATRSAKASACATTKSLFISSSDCGATVELARRSQLGVIAGASNVSSRPSGRLRRTWM